MAEHADIRGEMNAEMTLTAQPHSRDFAQPSSTNEGLALEDAKRVVGACPSFHRPVSTNLTRKPR